MIMSQCRLVKEHFYFSERISWKGN